MRFRQIDTITQLQPGERITAVKLLRAEESYLKDHFPRFPVMPGVLMLEAMYQSGMWLVRYSEDFASAMVVLAEARNVKFMDFVEPGEVLEVSAEIVKQDERRTTLRTRGTVDGNAAVSARLVLERYNLVDENPDWQANDDRMRFDMRALFETLYHPTASLEAVNRLVPPHSTPITR